MEVNDLQEDKPVAAVVAALTGFAVAHAVVASAAYLVDVSAAKSAQHIYCSAEAESKVGETMETTASCWFA